MTGSAEVFLDTNILLYAAMGRKSDPGKFAVARRIVAEEDYGTSGQVLAEFFVNATRMGRSPLSRAKASEWVETIALKPCQSVDPDIVRDAIKSSDQYKLSYWDAAIIVAADRMKARTLYTEDLEHGQAYGSVTAINPFLNT